ncbi:hypothetical protein B0J13DRAFT_84587 [Dactylonectria estremocensis]|uniref:Fungal N-terminal domain-containing protein n=1 Tax=Dactylonectria estremocensis TaxID=1079267 RepID=A0A9P9ECB1_9HYPO|nr:hypothetical protein B0J13DRAFT_84587 [Dactylonectria estremocensis]
MADPLSIAVSVFGLLGAGAKLIELLSTIARQSDAPPLCRSALNELCNVAAALGQLQHFLIDHMAVPTERREPVLLEQLAASLTGCVMTKDDLETLVDDVGLVYQESGISGVFDRVRWVRKEKDIEKLVQRLQNHKNSLNCMLTIFQASATAEIRDSVSRLYGLVEHVVSTNSALSVRLARLESNSTIGGLMHTVGQSTTLTRNLGLMRMMLPVSGLSCPCRIVAWPRGNIARIFSRCHWISRLAYKTLGFIEKCGSSTPTAILRRRLQPPPDGELRRPYSRQRLGTTAGIPRSAILASSQRRLLQAST